MTRTLHEQAPLVTAIAELGLLSWGSCFLSIMDGNLYLIDGSAPDGPVAVCSFIGISCDTFAQEHWRHDLPPVVTPRLGKYDRGGSPAKKFHPALRDA